MDGCVDEYVDGYKEGQVYELKCQKATDGKAI